jgi:hypothetical protein
MRETGEKNPKSRSLYRTEEAWQNAVECKRRYCRRYYEQHAKELNAKRRIRQAARNAILRRRRERLKARFDAVSADFGKVVIRLNFELGMSQTAINELLGGMISLTDIAKICQREQKRRHRLKASKSKTNDQRD